MPNVTITLPGEALDRAKERAAQQFRSLSQHVAYLIERDTARHTAAPSKPARRGKKHGRAAA